MPQVSGRKKHSFPLYLLLAATWDTTIANSYAQSIAEESRMLGLHFILGPGMNLYRSSLLGRNFEYVGEDPWLASQMISHYVQGAQSINVGTTLKHFVANESENYRRGSNSIVSERALNELYYPPFKAGISGGTWGLMTSYNLTNGEWNWACRARLVDVLRKTFGFKFIIMTDWDSSWDGVKLSQSGVDLEMPKGYSLQYDRAKVLGTPEIDNMVVDDLKTFIYSGLSSCNSRENLRNPNGLQIASAQRSSASG